MKMPAPVAEYRIAIAVGSRGPNQRPSRIEFGTLPIRAMPSPTQSPTLSWNCQSSCACAAIRKAAPSRNSPSE